VTERDPPAGAPVSTEIERSLWIGVRLAHELSETARRVAVADSRGDRATRRTCGCSTVASPRSPALVSRYSALTARSASGPLRRSLRALNERGIKAVMVAIGRTRRNAHRGGGGGAAC